eukprot:6175412-Pleurochrysis_carterae.AAC.1
MGRLTLINHACSWRPRVGSPAFSSERCTTKRRACQSSMPAKHEPKRFCRKRNGAGPSSRLARGRRYIAYYKLGHAGDYATRRELTTARR